MPPKKTQSSLQKAGSILKQHKKDVRKQVKQGMKELDIEKDLTVEIVQNTTELTILKKWAKKLHVYDIASYKISNIEALRNEIIKKLSNKEDEEKKIDFSRDLLEYEAVEKFLKSYRTNPAKTSSIYGKIGDEFNSMWKNMSTIEKTTFIAEYFELNVGPQKVNPVLYLGRFLESMSEKEKETPSRVVSSYLRLFIKNFGNPVDTIKNKMEELSTHELFPKAFLTKFLQLDKDTQIKFAGFYIRGSGGHRNPLDSLEQYLSPRKDDKIKRLPVKTLFIGGLRHKAFEQKDTALISTGSDSQNNYLKCTTTLQKKQWIIRPMDKEDSKRYISIPADVNGFYIPSDSFYKDICKYHSYILSPTESVIVINAEKRFSMEIRQSNGEEISPSKLHKDLQTAQTGNIFFKFSPWWILNTPLYLIDSVYLEQLENFLYSKSGINFSKIIGDLRKKNRYETYQTYVARFVYMFFPFFEGLVVDSSGKKRKANFFITAQLRSGYITQEAYANLSISQKVPEVNVKFIMEAVDKFIPGFSYNIVEGVGKAFLKIPPIDFDPFVLPSADDSIDYSKISFKCPEEDEYYPQDLIVYDNKCYVIPKLLSDFMNDKTGEFDKDFIEDIKSRYGHLVSEKFQKKPRIFKNEEGEDVEEPGEIFYVDKNIYDKAHPVIIKPLRKDKYNKEDLSDQFNRYFKIKHIILDPIGLLNGLMKFDPETKCQSCGNLVGSMKVTSAVNRSDGNIIELSFCDYKCMTEHEFKPMHIAEEELEMSEKIGNIVSKV